MNLEAGQFFGDWIKRIPLDKSAEIRHGNALRIERADFFPPGRLNFILGNPPFIGYSYQTLAQKKTWLLSLKTLRASACSIM